MGLWGGPIACHGSIQSVRHSVEDLAPAENSAAACYSSLVHCFALGPAAHALCRQLPAHVLEQTQATP